MPNPFYVGPTRKRRVAQEAVVRRRNPVSILGRVELAIQLARVLSARARLAPRKARIAGAQS